MNVDEIRARLKSLQGVKQKSKKWKPTDEHVGRLLSLPNDEDLAYKITWHYGVDGGRQMACPGNWGNSCPFCDFGKKLRSWKDEKGRDKDEQTRAMDWEFYKTIGPADKHYAPLILRKKDSTDVEGPFLWEHSPSTYQALLKICAIDDWNDDHPEGGALKVLTSLSHGLDLAISFKKAGEKGNTKMYNLTEVEERRKFSPVFKSDAGGVERAKALLDKIPSIDEIARPVSTAEAEAIFKKWQGTLGDEVQQKSSDRDVEYRTAGSNSEQTITGGASVDETVSKLQALLSQD